jgi:hypothetical protein
LVLAVLVPAAAVAVAVGQEVVVVGRGLVAAVKEGAKAPSKITQTCVEALSRCR